jgi:glucose dehydrogenase
MHTFRHYVKNKLCLCLWVLISLCFSLAAVAQFKTPTDNWPTYHGDNSGQRHSPLTQITPSNVNKLSQVWRFQTGQNQQIKATPILVNNVLYLSTPDNLWAIDVRTGSQLWHYANPANSAFHIGHRGVAVYKDFVYLTTPDAHLIALNANDGAVRWNVVVADSNNGRPIPDPAKEPSRNGRLVAPNESGATNYRSPSFDPTTGLFIVSAQDGYGIYFFKPEHGEYGWAGADYGVAGKAFLRAIDYQTGRIKWNHTLGDGASGAGVLTTDSGLTFTGDVPGNAMALRTSDGATLWHANIGRMGNAPITYQLNGRQFVIFGGGSSLYAFALQ